MGLWQVQKVNGESYTQFIRNTDHDFYALADYPEAPFDGVGDNQAGPWTAVGITTDLSAAWRYYDGGGSDNATLPSVLLTGSDGTYRGIHNESGSSAPSNSDQVANITTEFEYCIENSSSIFSLKSLFLSDIKCFQVIQLTPFYYSTCPSQNYSSPVCFSGLLKFDRQSFPLRSNQCKLRCSFALSLTYRSNCRLSHSSTCPDVK